MLTHRYHIVLSYAIVPICCTTSVVLTSIRSMRVLRQKILRRGGGFSGHGERPFHLHPPSNTISYVERHRSSSFTRTAMTAPSPRFRNQRPTSNGHQTASATSSNRGGRLPEVTPRAIRTTHNQQWDGINRQTCPRACHPETGPTEPIRGGR